MRWSKGRGKLGLFDPLLGIWQAQAKSEMDPVKCTREFKRVLAGKYIQLNASWEFADKSYNELAMIGVNSEKEVCFWSFTSDGKQSNGKLVDVTDVHPEAIGFEAQMPAGTARMAYWPDEENGFYWVVESKTIKSWNRFVEHHYSPLTHTNS
jgi:hypothetical protein